MTADMSDQVFRGRNVDSAIEAGLAATGLRRDEVDVEVIHPGSRGLLGIGAEEARVRLTRIQRPTPQKRPKTPQNSASQQVVAAKEEPNTTPMRTEPPTAAAIQPSADSTADDEQVLAEASRLLQGLLDRMGLRSKVIGYQKQDQDSEEELSLVLNIQGDDLGILIGRRGETLAALQYLVRLMVNHRQRRWVNIVVDVEEYKERRTQQLRQLAERMAERAMETGKPVTLEAMPARERRIIHMTLRDHPTVTTQSVGEGEKRKVTILFR